MRTSGQPGVLRLLRAVMVVATAVLMAGVAAPAHADAPVTLGGGSGLVVDGETLCTLTAIGTDNRGSLIGFTSAHCGGPGAVVAAEGAENAGVVGTMVAGNDGLDYASKWRHGPPMRTTDGSGGAITSLTGQRSTPAYRRWWPMLWRPGRVRGSALRGSP